MTLDFENLVDTGDPLNRGLVLWWLVLPNPRNTGSRFRDLTGKNHGTLINGPTWQGLRGRKGGFGSLLFDGSNDIVEGSYVYDIGTTWTASCWYKRSNTSRSSPGNDFLIVVENGFYLMVGDTSAGPLANKIGCYGPVNLALTGTASVTNTDWHHAVVTRNGSSYVLYFDGRQDATGTLTEANGTLSVPKFGGFSSSPTFGYYAGQVDDVRLYNRALSASEVRRLYDDSRMGYPSTLRRINPVTYFLPSASSAFPFHYYQQLYLAC